MRFSTRATIRFAALCAALVAALLGSAVASAQPTPSQQSAVGTFVAGFLFGSFSAVSDAGGANPSGQVNYQLGGPTTGSRTNATVVCLSVSGNTAVIGFQGTIDNPFPPPPQRVVGELLVVDNAPGPTFLDTVAISQRITDTGTANCSAPGPVSIGPFQVSGDVIVHEAALPTDKDQCKNGGWRNFGVFKNQGDCVSFVATGGKNPPAGP
jgi:hypothetical protein